MKTLFRVIFLALAVVAVLPLLTAGALASERILHFKSDIVVHPDSTMTVTETIKVRSTGREIKRGIIREFPTTYKDRLGHTVKVDFQVEEVLRDGAREPFHLEPVANGVKIYIGKKEVFLPPGVYTYTIRYQTGRQLGFFQDFDELYWNVTGNGWTFAIDQAEAVIELPPGAQVLRNAAYTGPMGAKGQDYQVQTPGGGNIVFSTTRGLSPREGLTIAVSWPKGVVRAPSGQEKMALLLKDNLTAATALIWLATIFCFYLFVWFRVGRDPAGDTIIPLFTPPKDFSPAAVRYLMRMGFDQKSLAAAVVDMAVKGYLTIEEQEGTYTLHKKSANPTALSRDEEKVAAQLFGRGADLEMKDTNHESIGGALEALKKNLQKELEKIYFVTNSSYFVSGLVLTLLALGAIVLTAPDRPLAAFFSIWLSLWTAGCYAIAVMVYKRWKQVGRGGFQVLVTLGVSLFALPFFAFEIVGVGAFAYAISLAAALFLGGIAFLNALFYHLLKAPTLAGRKIMDLIEGFKLYLSVAEQERLNLLNPPEKTPELFEKYLPYALALDVENEWSEQFADVLAQSAVAGRGYSPHWYSGRSWDSTGTSGFADSLGSSFSGAIASSSSAPGSSSGSGGGGSSGGGGGGGGGSGW